MSMNSKATPTSSKNGRIERNAHINPRGTNEDDVFGTQGRSIYRPTPVPRDATPNVSNIPYISKVHYRPRTFLSSPSTPASSTPTTPSFSSKSSSSSPSSSPAARLLSSTSSSPLASPKNPWAKVTKKTYQQWIKARYQRALAYQDYRNSIHYEGPKTLAGAWDHLDADTKDFAMEMELQEGEVVDEEEWQEWKAMQAVANEMFAMYVDCKE